MIGTAFRRCFVSGRISFLEHGWAYGRTERALRGKAATHAVTCGGTEAAYRADGLNRHSIAEFMRPSEQTARLCGMVWHDPFVANGTHAMTVADIDAQTRSYRASLERLQSGGRGDDAPPTRPGTAFEP